MKLVDLINNLENEITCDYEMISLDDFKKLPYSYDTIDVFIKKGIDLDSEMTPDLINQVEKFRFRTIIIEDIKKPESTNNSVLYPTIKFKYSDDKLKLKLEVIQVVQN